MSFNYNKVMLAGNLTRDPEVKFLPSEQAVASFGLAINRKYKGSDGQMKEDTTFVDCEAWGRTAELVGQYLTKGSPCFLEGRMKLEMWEDKKDGSKRSKLKVVADSVQFLGQKKDAEPAADEGPTTTDAARAAVERQRVATPAAPGASAGDDEPPFSRFESADRWG